MSDANEHPVHRGAFKAKKGLYVTGDAAVTGALTLSGGLNFAGDIPLGATTLNITDTLSAVGDVFLGGDQTDSIVIGTQGGVITLVGGIDGEIKPALHNTYDLGTQFMAFKDARLAGTLFANSVSAAADVTWDTDSGTKSLRQFYNLVTGNSGQWGASADITDITNTVASNSAAWSSSTTSNGLTSWTETTGHIIPNANASFDIGNAEYKVRHLFLSDNSIWYGDTYKQEGKERKQRKKDTLPQWFKSRAISDNDAIQWYNSENPASQITVVQELKLEDLIAFAKTKESDTEIEDIYPPSYEGTYTTEDYVYVTKDDDVAEVTTAVQTNSAQWATDTGGGGGGGGSAGAFITDLTCGDNNNRNNGISQLTEDSDEVQVNGERPLVSALVDNSNVRIWCQWEGSASEWTGTPKISGHPIPRGDTTSIGGNHARRFQGHVDLNFDDFKGQNNVITLSYEGLEKTFDLEIAGGGPEVTNIEITSAPSYQQDHYKDGDPITFVIEFDTEDVSKIILDGGNDTAVAQQTINSVTMNQTSATITTDIQTTLTSKQSRGIKVKAQNSLGTEGSETNSDTYGQTVTVLNGPVIENVEFNTPIYPGSQTELKSGDTVEATFTFDTTNVNRVNLDGFGDNNYASTDQNVSVVMTDKTGVGTITIDTTLQDAGVRVNERPIRVRGQMTGHHAQPGEFHISTDKLWVNNVKPTFSFGGVTYPAGQSALKGSEEATVALTITNTDGGSTYTYSDNNRGEIEQSSDPWDTYKQNIKVKHKNSTYNVTSSNFKCVATRESNGSVNEYTTAIAVAAAAPTITIASNSGNRMRSGGNDGTSKGSYTIRITSNQRLKQAPTLSAPEGDLGTFSYSSNSTTFNATMEVHDNDPKGTFQYTGLEAINQAGVSTNTITSGAQYELGGFKSRTVNLIPGTNSQVINVLWSNYNKLSLTWSAGISLTRAAAGTSPTVTGKWCISDQTVSNTGTPGGPITILILDTSAAGNWTTPSTLTIQEAV